MNPRSPKLHILILTGLLLLVARHIPAEQTLGTLIRPILVHGALT